MNYAQCSYLFNPLCFGTSIFYPYLSSWLQWCWSNPTTEPSHKSHTAFDQYTTMHHFLTEMCTQVHISVTKQCIVGYWTGALWDYLCNRSISYKLIHTINLHLHNTTTTQHSTKTVDISQRKLCMGDNLEYDGVFFIIHCCYCASLPTNSLAPGRCGNNFEITIRLM